MYEIQSRFKLETRVEDDADDDPSVWQYYADNLGAAVSFLSDVDPGQFDSADALQAELGGRRETCDGWIKVIEDDQRMRRADVVMLLDVIGASPSKSRSGAIESLTRRILEIVRSKMQIFQASNARPW